MITNSNKTYKKSRYFLEFLTNSKWQVFFVILAIAGITLGYRLGFISENLTSSLKIKTAVLIKMPEPLTQQPSDKNKFIRKIIKEPPLKNTFGKVVEPNNLITPPNLTVTKKTIFATEVAQKAVKKLARLNNRNSFKNLDINTIKRDAKEQFIGTTLSPIQKVSTKSVPKIAIVIDDLGIDLSRSSRTIKLKGPLTLSFLTYAPKLKKQTKEARNAGHELWMHMPMEPHSLSVDPGLNVLLTGLPREELQAAIQWNLKQFSDYVGINNHMGSRFTADLKSVRIFMRELKKHNLMFLDSRTSSHSVTERAAIEVGVPFIVRNIFIDHFDETGEIRKSLAQVERLALKSGYAVAIGHPRDKTLREIGPWLNSIENRGFQLVPLSTLIKRP